jgi:nitroreductase
MDLLTAMQTMNACRYYKSDAVDDAVLAKVLNAARWAATGSNKQPVSFIAVRDAAKRQALHDLYQPIWDMAMQKYSSGEFKSGFSTKFLKNGSYCDLPRSLRLANLLPMLSVAKDNFPLEEYLLGQVLQTNGHRFKALREYYPTMQEDDWQLAVAGQRVQIIKQEKHYAGQLEFGTEIVAAADGTIVALLGASPGASTATYIMVTMIETVLREDLVGDWKAKMIAMIPSYGHNLKVDAALLKKVRADTAAVLGLQNV